MPLAPTKFPISPLWVLGVHNTDATLFRGHPISLFGLPTLFLALHATISWLFPSALPGQFWSAEDLHGIGEARPGMPGLKVTITGGRMQTPGT